MDKINNIKNWMAQIRAPFLLLAILLVAIGLAFGWKYHPAGTEFNPLHAVLLVIGVLAAHISVNLFNEYSDNKTKIDHNTPRTPFSGGNGILSGGKLKSRTVFRTAVATILLAKILLGELFSGLTLCMFVVLGSYASMTASPEMAVNELFPKDVLLMSIPPGILTALLLFINEFPDLEADKQG